MKKVPGYTAPPSDKKCPLFKQTMDKCCPTCDRWRYFWGKNDDGEPYKVFNCTDVWTTLFMLENSKHVFQLGAATENMRNIIASRGNARERKNYFEIKTNETDQIASDQVKLLEHKEGTEMPAKRKGPHTPKAFPGHKSASRKLSVKKHGPKATKSNFMPTIKKSVNHSQG